MSDAWYYADSGAARGPMPIGDVVNAISAMRSPADTMVWRAGFQSWMKAADVPEIAQRVLTPAPFLPPPLPGRAPLPPAAPEVGPSAEPPAIGGWLILVGIGQVVGPIRLLVSLGQYYAALEWEVAARFPAAFLGEAALSTAYLILVVLTAVLFFRRSRLFPRFFVYEVIATVVYFPLGAVWVAMTISAVSGQSFNDLFAGAFEPKEVGQVIVAGIVGCLWIWYLYASKRVARTFVR
jgi:hypothetical protein